VSPRRKPQANRNARGSGKGGKGGKTGDRGEERNIEEIGLGFSRILKSTIDGIYEVRNHGFEFYKTISLSRL
jgi:hypothetical protein